MYRYLHLFLLGFLVLGFACKKPLDAPKFQESTVLFNQGWEFTKDSLIVADNAVWAVQDSSVWESVSLPHTAQIEPAVIKGNQWQGLCLYRKFFALDANQLGKHIGIYFEGAMQVASVYLNGKEIYTNYGGYLPFYVDLTGVITDTQEQCITVLLDNRDNPQVPPGKAMNTLDFNIYSGIYRNVWFVEKDLLHITNAMSAKKVAGGGVFVSYGKVDSQQALLHVKVDVANASAVNAQSVVSAELTDAKGVLVASAKSTVQAIQAGDSAVIGLDLTVANPSLWSPDAPELYTLQLNLLKDETVVDRETLRVGIRDLRISADSGLVLNGKSIKIRGTNRHQEYPYIGYALSDLANYRDAYKIKQAGFNFVRLSHYPQTKSFLDACDELGLLVMDAIPGWQFVGDDLFKSRSIADVRNMVRRDRNHPSVIIWEASLNESGMDSVYMQAAHNAVHEEYPAPYTYTSGWIDAVYDIYIPARQHAKPPYYWNKYDKKKPILISEYGDWEYYAQNAGFNQKAYNDITEEERNSRQLRSYGQKRLMQQALNFQEAHNDNLNGKNLGDANWLMFDYNRGYAPDIESSGIADIFRLPKFAYYFYQSQADILANQMGGFNKPMVVIANYYNDPSSQEIKVYSNCDEVELLLNGKSVGKQSADKAENSKNLTHAPFTFTLKEFIPGTLTANAYVAGKLMASSAQTTPSAAVGLKLVLDESGKPLTKACGDVVFVYASVVDKDGVMVPQATNRVAFTVKGDATLIGANPFEAEAGIATILLKAGDSAGNITIEASSPGLQTTSLRLTLK